MDLLVVIIIDLLLLCTLAITCLMFLVGLHMFKHGNYFSLKFIKSWNNMDKKFCFII
jgi:hypothetical protein